jgi:hypothetical protein
MGGMRFPGELQPNEQRTMMMVITVASTTDSAATIMRDVLTNPASVGESSPTLLRVLPNPANDVVSVHHGQGCDRLTIVDVRGSVCAVADVSPITGITSIDLSSLSDGLYLVIASGSGPSSSLPLTILR